AYRYGVDAVTLIMYRMLFALPLFLVLLWWVNHRPGRDKKPEPLSRRDWLGVLGLGFTGYYLASSLDFWALQSISAGLARRSPYRSPPLGLLLGCLLSRRRGGRWQGPATAVRYGGVLLVFGHEAAQQGPYPLRGALIVFASGISHAIYLVYSG